MSFPTTAILDNFNRTNVGPPPSASWSRAAAVQDSYALTVPTGITLDSSSFTTTAVTAWLSGGTAGVTYTVTCKIVTAGGRTDERSILVQVENK